MITEKQWYVIPDNYTAEFLDEVLMKANHKNNKGEIV